MDIKAYLRDLDREEDQLRAEIARIQVRIANLHDMRVLMMHREEERARREGKVSPFGELPGEIVVRDTELGLQSHQAKYGQLPAPQPLPPRDDGKPMGWPEKVARHLEANGPTTSADLVKALGAPDAKPVNRAVAQMKNRGYVVKGKDRRWALTGKPPVFYAAPSSPRSTAGRTPGLGEISAKVLEALARAGRPLPSRDLVTAVYGPHEPGAIGKMDLDRVYGAVSSLKRSGKVVTDHHGHRLAKPLRQAAAE